MILSLTFSNPYISSSRTLFAYETSQFEGVNLFQGTLNTSSRYVLILLYSLEFLSIELNLSISYLTFSREGVSSIKCSLEIYYLINFC